MVGADKPLVEDSKIEEFINILSQINRLDSVMREWRSGVGGFLKI
jgi:hypothetical protein